MATFANWFATLVHTSFWLALLTGCEQAPDFDAASVTRPQGTRLVADGAPADTAAAVGSGTPQREPAAVLRRSDDAPARGLTLIGTTLARHGSFAVVRDAGGAGFLQLRVGDQVAGMVLTAIEPGRVTLTTAGAARGEAAARIFLEADGVRQVPHEFAPVAALGVAEQPSNVAASLAVPSPEHYNEPNPETVVEGH